MLEKDKQSISLSEEQLRQIDEKYSELSDSDIIEQLAYLEINNDDKRIVITDIEPTSEIISVSNQIFEIKKDFQKIKTMFELFVSDVSEFLSVKNKLESKKLEIKDADVNCLLILTKIKSSKNIPKIVRSLIAYIVLLAISMIRTLLIDFAIL